MTERVSVVTRMPMTPVAMRIAGLTIDPANNAPVVVLGEENGERLVPIWIGPAEASAIAFELEGLRLPRPMTHDLLKNAILTLGGEVQSVSVVDLREGTYFASITVMSAGHRYDLDARPSDALALALRVKAPIFCAENVVEQAHLQRVGDDSDDANGGPQPVIDVGQPLPPEFLASLDAEAFGRP